MMQNKRNNCPLFSVVIPAYNRADVLSHAVESVFKPIPKNTQTLEIIIINDGSTDETLTVAKSLQKQDNRIRVFSFQKNKGVNAARNVGVLHARGTYIVFLDSDDVLVPLWYETLHTLHMRGSLREVNFFGTIDERKKPMFTIPRSGHFTYEEYLTGVVSGEFLPVVLRTIHKKKLLRFDEQRLAFEQFFWMRAIRYYGVSCFSKPLRHYSFAQTNRVSKRLVDPAFATIRARDYDDYIAEFKKDYDSYCLYNKDAKNAWSGVLLSAAYYHTIAGKRLRGRSLVRSSLSVRSSFQGIVLLLSTIFPFWFIRVLTQIYLHFRAD